MLTLSLCAAENFEEVMEFYMPMVYRIAFARLADRSDAEDVTLLNAATVRLEIVIADGTTGDVVWRSGVVAYSENYENTRESVAIREVLAQAVYRVLDRMQQQDF